jgi:hypothetical protein
MWRSQPTDLNISYLNLRRIVGSIGLLLPLVLGVGIIVLNQNVPYSISSYYYSPMRNILVASLCVLGVFLITYRGYDSVDSWITNVAGAAAIGVAFFPTSNPSFTPAWVGRVHPYFAAVALVSLALMALQFTQTWPTGGGAGAGGAASSWAEDFRQMGLALIFRYEDRGGTRTRRKKIRDRLYSSCAWLILIGVALAFAQNFWPASAKGVTPWLFWFESLAIVAFGTSWLVKGETILTDDPAPRDTPASQADGQRAVQKGAPSKEAPLQPETS